MLKAKRNVQTLETLLELHCESMMLDASAALEYGFKLDAMIMLGLFLKNMIDRD